MPIRRMKATPYIPTQPLTGSEGVSLFRLSNMLVRGQEPFTYLEVYSGSENLNEQIITSFPITGTIAYTSGSRTVTGTATKFLEELHIGQFIQVGTEVFVVERLDSQTSFLAAKAATATASGQTPYPLSVLFEINRQRGSMARGNLLKFDKGTVLGVGLGQVKINGAALPGGGMTFTNRKPLIGLLNPSTGNYSIFTLGMTVPAAPTVAEVAGGTKNMQVGNYSVMIAPAKTVTGGYNNPSPAVEVAITAAGNKIRITFPAMDTTHGQDAWWVFGTLWSANQGITGPWYLIDTITSTDLGGTGAGTTFDFEWRDAEISGNELASFDNDPPVDAEFVASLQGFPVYISCQGQGFSSTITSTSPGPFIIPAKPNNIEAAPLSGAVSTNPPETIIGVVSALGKLYLMTQRSLQIAQFSGNPAFPVVVRPFWHSGFQNPYQLSFVNGVLYGYTQFGPTRSVEDGDPGAEQFDFASRVSSITKTWTVGHVLVAHDPLNNAICYFHSGDSKNVFGYWITRILVYGLQQQDWIGDITLSSSSRDMIVSGIATVGDRLEFLSGGRVSGFPVRNDTYRFDTGAEASQWHAAWSFSDDGVEDRDKKVGRIRVTGKMSAATASPTAGVHGAGAGEVISISTLEAGNSGSKSGSINLPGSSGVTQNPQVQINVPQLATWTVRVDGLWPGTGDKDSIHEVIADYDVQGCRR